MYLAISNPNAAVVPPTSVLLTILFSRALMGFAIGISALRMAWWLHGIFLGAVSSLPMFFSVMDRIDIAIGSVVMGIIYGFLTELITSILLKAKSPFV
ncbi:MAG: hypothetical protein A2V66_18225 [Ignavibacteria bacterium RBG_13_36_8]|nr:MAG: hypothetical protein A2V66_18225 [Ignavibacteria bacterium RBG_13_36_8]